MIRLLALGALLALAGGAAASGLDAAAGKALFERQWVAAPASTDAADGLGPLFNAKSCNSCHKDGGAARIIDLDGKAVARGLVVRLAAPGGGPHVKFGGQLQDRAVAGLMPEGEVRAAIADGQLRIAVKFFDGTADAIIEPRLAPSLRGRGWLERVDEAAVLALADPGDRDGDGISGRARFVEDRAGRRSLGRFGAKATAANLDAQAADAAAIDLGLSSPLRPLAHGDCTGAQAECLAMATGRSGAFEGEELSVEMVGLMADYLRSLKPARHKPPAGALQLFAATGCAACHQPAMPGRAGETLPVFTDLLLHDLGAEASGVIADAGATAAEWRTAPLMDIDPLDGMRRYLHDGRAATIGRAIELHGGEAQAARAAYLALPPEARDELIAYVSGL